MKQIITLILILITHFCFSSNHEKLERYINASIEIAKDPLIIEIFAEPDNKMTTVFILSNGISQRLIDTLINEKLRLEIYSGKEELFFSGQEYWLETSDYQSKKNRIDYTLSLNSFSEIQELNYMQFEYKLTFNSGLINIENSKKKPIEFGKFTVNHMKGLDKYEEERYYYKNCRNYDLTEVSRRKFQNTNDTVEGNWQLIMDSVYYEVLFANDSLYGYSSDMGNIVSTPYKIENRMLIRKELYKWEITTLEINYIVFTKPDPNEHPHLDSIFHFHRIPDNEFTFDKVKCWKSIERKNGTYKASRKENKYVEEFFRRRNDFINNAL